MYSFIIWIHFWCEDQNKNFEGRGFWFVKVDLFYKVILKYPQTEGESRHYLGPRSTTRVGGSLPCWPNRCRWVCTLCRRPGTLVTARAGTWQALRKLKKIPSENQLCHEPDQPEILYHKTGNVSLKCHKQNSIIKKKDNKN